MSKLKVDEVAKLEEFTRGVSLVLEKIWDKPVVFEHGSCGTHENAGACIDHAHWHLVPGNWQLFSVKEESNKIESLDAFFSEINSQIPYLFFRDYSGNSYWRNGIGVPSQFFRRRLATLLGVPEKWDYLAYPYFQNIRTTIDKLEMERSN